MNARRCVTTSMGSGSSPSSASCNLGGINSPSCYTFGVPLPKFRGSPRPVAAHFLFRWRARYRMPSDALALIRKLKGQAQVRLNGGAVLRRGILQMDRVELAVCRSRRRPPHFAPPKLRLACPRIEALLHASPVALFASF